MELLLFLVLLGWAFSKAVKYADSTRKPSLVVLGLLVGACTSAAAMLSGTML